MKVLKKSLMAIMVCLFAGAMSSCIDMRAKMNFEWAVFWQNLLMCPEDLGNGWVLESMDFEGDTLIQNITFDDSAMTIEDVEAIYSDPGLLQEIKDDIVSESAHDWYYFKACDIKVRFVLTGRCGGETYSVDLDF